MVRLFVLRFVGCCLRCWELCFVCVFVRKYLVCCDVVGECCVFVEVFCVVWVLC